ncbi:MAG: phage baseplate assembly protein [Myxococcota bacterium]
MNVNVIRRLLSDALAPIRARVDTLVQRVVIQAVNDAAMAQQVTVTALAGDGDGVEFEHCQPFGVSFRPAVGAEGIALSVGGEAAYQLVLGVQDREKRPAESVEEGEGGLYLDGLYRVFIAADGVVHLGEQTASDFVALAAKVLTELQNIKTWFDTHTHPTSMGPTSPPTTPMPAPASVAASKARAT